MPALRLKRRHLLALCVCAPALAAANDRELSVTFAYNAVLDERLLLIDIRTRHEWRRTGIPHGAHGIDMESETFYQDLLALANKYPTRNIALISTTGGRSAFMSRYLSRRGVSVYDVPGGIVGKSSSWRSKDLPFTEYR